MRNGIEVDEAIQLLLDIPVKLKTETVPIGDSTGRICSDKVEALIPFPPFNRSPFDGYAIRGEDTALASKDSPITLIVNQEIPAGFTPKEAVDTGFAAKILTGAPIPSGANAVIKFEETEFTENSVTIFNPVKPDSNIVRAGEDIDVGTVILQSGDVIGPAAIGLLAAQGLSEVNVYKKPVVSIVNTGTELSELGQPLPPGKIYNSSMYTLQGFIKRTGAEFRDGGIVEDDKAVIAERIKNELAVSDMVITTGGASVGDYDCSLAAAEYAGAEIFFWKIKMRPGGSLLAYTIGEKLVIALSGNPGAAVLGLLLFGVPCIKKRAGFADVMFEECSVRLTADEKKTSPVKRIKRGYLKISDGEAFFIENEGQGGGDISSLMNCDLLVEIPGGSQLLTAGALVKAYRVF